MKKKLIIGITGGSGTGKSSVLKSFSDSGALIIDGDKVSREITKPTSPALFEICSHFGDGVLAKDGTLNRKKLGNIVFKDKDELSILNKITHKYIKEDILRKIENAKNPLIIIEAAELILGGLGEICDATVCILSKKDKRKERIILRDDLTEEQAENRINSQKSDEYYIENCDFCVYNDDSLADAISSLKKIIDDIGDRYV